MRLCRRPNQTLTLLRLAACVIAMPVLGFGVEMVQFADDVLDIDCGARVAALGTAALVDPGDVSAAHYNPAALATASDREALLMHSEQFASEAQADLAAFSLQLRPGLGAGIVLSRSTISSIPDTRGLSLDAQGVPIYDESQIRYISAQDYVLTMGIGKDIGHRLLVGGAVRAYYRDQAIQTGLGATADLSVQWRPQSRLAVALVARNITTAYTTWSSGTNEATGPSMYLTAGYFKDVPYFYGAFALYFRTPSLLPTGSLENWSGDPSSIDLREDPLQVLTSGSVGAEYCFRKMLWLRGGIRSGVQYSAGAGLALRRENVHNASLAGLFDRSSIREIGLDYAFRTHPELSNSHLLSLRAGF